MAVPRRVGIFTYFCYISPTVYSMKIPFRLTALFLLWCSCAAAQNNYCDDLVADTDKVRGAVTLRTPEANIMLRRIQADGKEEVWVNFNIRHLSEFVMEEGGLFIRFEDGRMLRYFGQRVKHTFLSVRDGYVYETDLRLGADEVALLRSKKIKKFQVAGIDVPVTDELATQVEAYVICLEGTK